MIIENWKFIESIIFLHTVNKFANTSLQMECVHIVYAIILQEIKYFINNFNNFTTIPSILCPRNFLPCKCFDNVVNLRCNLSFTKPNLSST